MTEKSPVKLNSKHGGKEFRTYFRIVGQVKPVRRKDEASDSWVDVPIYEQTNSRNTGKPIRRVQFNIETSQSNELKVELMGMEQEFAYPYSSADRKAAKVAWADRNDKTKYPNDTYHLIDPDWDKAEKIGTEIEVGKWVEIRGHYDVNEFQNNEGEDRRTVKRIIDNYTVLEPGTKVKVGAGRRDDVEIDYVYDLKSPDFKEINYFNAQIGIISTYQHPETQDTKVNGVLLTYGKDRSEPKEIEMMVYQTPVAEGKKSLADAFASLNRLDFLEVIGTDNNRATFAMVEVEEKLQDDDPFADVDESTKEPKYEYVTTGTKKGLEIKGYVQGTIIRDFLTEAEITKAAQTTTNDPFGDVDADPFANDDEDPFK